MTGFERIEETPEKVLALYDAIEALISEGVDINSLKVSTITEKAGIGKGTAYEYFESKEDLIACAIVAYIRKMGEELRSLISTRDSFAGKINVLLNVIDKKDSQPQCLMVRYVHVMTDKSQISKLIQEKLNTEEMKKELPVGIFGEVISLGRERGEVKKDIPLNYATYVLTARLATYLLCVAGRAFTDDDPVKIREYVYNGIMSDLAI